MDSPARLRLHLGAHKTASTHLNEMIRLNEPALDAAGVAAVHKDVLRAPLAAAMRDAARGLPESEGWAETRARHTSGRAWLVSEELILGLAGDAGPSGGLYPAAPHRLTLALRVLGAAPGRTELMIAVRNPATLFPSAWAEATRNRPTPPFREWLGTARLGQPYWTRLLERLSEAAPGCPITVWRYETYAADPARIFPLLLGLPAGAAVEFERLPEVVRPGLSAQAIAAIHARRAAEADLPASEVDRIVADHPRGPDRPGPDPFTPMEREALDAAHADDLDQLARLPAVRFVG